MYISTVPCSEKSPTTYQLQTLKDLETETERSKYLNSELSSVQAGLRTELEKVAERDEELGTLRSCLLQVTGDSADHANGTDAANDEVDGGRDDEEMTDGDELDVVKMKESRLRKVQAMLDTTKAREHSYLLVAIIVVGLVCYLC